MTDFRRSAFIGMSSEHHYNPEFITLLISVDQITVDQCYEFWVIKVIPMNAERQKSSFEMPCGYICTYLEFGPMGPMQI